MARANVETFRADKATLGAASFEGHQRLTVTGEWKAEPRAVTAGALFVPIAQPKARLVMAMLEPQAPDSLLAWGTFNNCLRAQGIHGRLRGRGRGARADGGRSGAGGRVQRRAWRAIRRLPRTPQARLEFFARRHSSWDERLNLYPVLRTDTAL